VTDVLIDTSTWVAALRGTDKKIMGTVDHLLDLERVIFCGVVEMELLHGIRPLEQKRLLPLFEALPYVEADRNDWKEAGSMMNKLRSKGITIPSTDALIAALCLRHGFSLLTLDHHFDRIPKVKHFKV